MGSDGVCELVKCVIQGKVVSGKRRCERTDTGNIIKWMDGIKLRLNHAGLEGSRYAEKIGARCCTGG